MYCCQSTHRAVTHRPPRCPALDCRPPPARPLTQHGSAAVGGGWPAPRRITHNNYATFLPPKTELSKNKKQKLNVTSLAKITCQQRKRDGSQLDPADRRLPHLDQFRRYSPRRRNSVGRRSRIFLYAAGVTCTLSAWNHGSSLPFSRRVPSPTTRCRFIVCVRRWPGL